MEFKNLDDDAEIKINDHATESRIIKHADNDKNDGMMMQNSNSVEMIMIRDTGNDHTDDEGKTGHADKGNQALVQDKTDVHADKIEIDCERAGDKTDYDYDYVDELQYGGMSDGYDVDEMNDGQGVGEGVQEQCVQRCPGSNIACTLSGCSHDLEMEASQPSQSGHATDADLSDSNSELADESHRLDRSHLG